jgi:hypothetical protein
MTETNAQKIIDSCECEWEAFKADCSGFVKAVAQHLQINDLQGNANDITDYLHTLPTSTTDGVLAANWAANGFLVIAGLKGQDQASPDAHGHVVVVVTGPLAHDKYPTAYWGQLGGVGKKATTLNWAWTQEDRDKVIYGQIALP